MARCGYSLSAIILEIAERAGMDPRQVDVNTLEDVVDGFAVTNGYPAMGAIQALAQVFFFDPANFDARVHFVKRGANAVATITEGDLLDDDQEIEVTKRADAIQIPRVMHLNYYDVQGGTATDKQSSERSGEDRRAKGEVSLSTAVVMSADQAAQVVRINHKIMIEDQQGEFRLSLGDNWSYLVPSDCVFLDIGGAVKRARIGKIDTQDGYQELVLVRDRQSAYESSVEGIPAASQTLPPSNVIGPTLLEVLDIPILRDAGDGAGLIYYVAIAGAEDAWTGAVVELSYDGGANYIDSSDSSVPSTIGELVTELGDHPYEFPDQVHTCRVRLETFGADLEETTLAGMQSRNNLALIGDEIVNFANADEVEEGVWELSLFLRGRKGTDTATHAPGTRFVLLDKFTPIAASVTDLGKALTFRATSFGAAADTGTVKTITYLGRSQTERRPDYLEARRDGTNAVVTWQGVGRLGAGDVVAHGARFTGYRVTFDDGIAPPVVVDTSAQTVTQSVAGLASPLIISVAQVNALTGAGPPSEVTLP